MRAAILIAMMMLMSFQTCAETISMKQVILEHAKSEEYQKFGYPLLTYAIAHRYREIAFQLLAANVDPNGLAKKNYTSALIEAVLSEDSQLVEMLLSKGANPNVVIKNIVSSTPIVTAVQTNKESYVLQILLSFAADSKGALEAAIRKADMEKFNMLIDHGAEVNIPNDNTTPHFITLLTIASQAPKKEQRPIRLKMIQRLLELGVDVNLHGIYAWTPIESAAYDNWLEAVELLLSSGANINETSKFEKQTIIGAVVRGYPHFKTSIGQTARIIRIFLELGADINASTLCDIKFSVSNKIYRFYATPLVQAVLNNNFDLAEELISCGAKTEELIQSDHESGFTPLLFAIKYENEEGVRFLLRHGADPTNMGSTTYIPLDYALSIGKFQMADDIAHAIAEKLSH